MKKRRVSCEKSAMPDTAKKMLLFVLIVAASVLPQVTSSVAFAAASNMPAASHGLWRAFEERGFVAKGERLIVPEHYRMVALDQDMLSVILSGAPAEGSEPHAGPL